jgi:hypothetical protein
VHHKACLFAGILVAGCTAGVPSGFSKGDRWTLPLVGPLEDGLLITPVSVRGHGPYLFLIDPDADGSAVDQQVVDEASLTIGVGPSRFDETGTEQTRAYAELLDLQAGSLTIDRRSAMVVPTTFYNTEGRRVNGVLGRDVIADALVFGFDREQGIVTLSTRKAFTPPPDAIAVTYQAVSVDPDSVRTGGGPADPNTSGRDASSRVGANTSGSRFDIALERRVAAAQIDGVKVAMHLDLGGPVSQLREPLWSKVKLTPTDVKLRLVDEAGTVREVAHAGIAGTVTLGAAKASHVTLVPYTDRRFAVAKVDGALGLDFFQPYAVYASWGSNTFYLKARGDAAATTVARLGRWGAPLPACPHPGCVTVSATTTDLGIRFDVVRDPESAHHALEVRLGVTPAPGKSAAPLLVELPSDVDKLTGGISGEYGGATFTVLDVSPFIRSCEGNAGCVIPLASPTAHER